MAPCLISCTEGEVALLDKIGLKACRLWSGVIIFNASLNNASDMRLFAHSISHVPACALLCVVRLNVRKLAARLVCVLLWAASARFLARPDNLVSVISETDFFHQSGKRASQFQEMSLQGLLDSWLSSCSRRSVEYADCFLQLCYGFARGTQPRDR